MIQGLISREFVYQVSTPALVYADMVLDCPRFQGKLKEKNVTLSLLIGDIVNLI